MSGLSPNDTWTPSHYLNGPIIVHMIPEFVSVHRSNVPGAEVSADENERPEAVYFRGHLDGDQSGFLDVEEISKWVEPTGFIQVRYPFFTIHNQKIK